MWRSEPWAPPLNQAQAFALEHARVTARRKALSVETTPYDPQVERDPDEAIGLSLSGGGIRSATFALGLLRALGERKLLPYVDYLSTVSGGGYIGSFLCSCYVPDSVRGDVIQEAPAAGNPVVPADPFAGPAGQHSLEHLRQSGRYLLPNSTGDAVRMIVIASRGWLGIHAVIGLTMVALIMISKLVQALYLRSDWMLDQEAAFAGALQLPPSLWPSQWMQGYPIGHWVIASWLWLPAAPFLMVTAGLFWSFFLTRSAPNIGSRLLRVIFGPSSLVGVVGVGAGVMLIIWPEWAGAGLAVPRAVGVALVILSAVALIGYLFGELVDFLKSKFQLVTMMSVGREGERAAVRAEADQATRAPTRSPRLQEDRVRTLLTDWATTTLLIGLFLAALATFDTIAQTIYVRRSELAGYATAGLGSLALLPIARQILLRLSGPPAAGKKWAAFVGRFGRTIALLVGLLLCFMLGIFWAFVAQAVAWRNGPIGTVLGPPGAFHEPPLVALELTVAALLIVNLCIGFSFGFLNLSSFSSFYAARLRRAYLGASNRERWRSGRVVVSINADHINDDIALDHYYDANVMAPLHLINVTINDTKSGSSNTVQRDQRGKPLVISPAGFLFPLDEGPDLAGVPLHHAADKSGPEQLPLSTWVGLSGAAASTGMGQVGSLGLSLLAGLANVRLGNWWDAGRRDKKHARNFVQGRLAAEFLGRFPGTDGRRWYLTDGGHFENSGAYELIRRKMGFIIMSDNGADPDYQFADLVNLVRRVRIDFDAEIVFAGDATLHALVADDPGLRNAFGTIAELSGVRQADKRMGPYAALGRIRYLREPDRAPSTLLLVKPRICGHEAPDLVAYAKANPSFPQQTTLDQFFDEAQWESYYRLGLGIGETLFRPVPGGKWHPAHMVPIPAENWAAIAEIGN